MATRNRLDLVLGCVTVLSLAACGDDGVDGQAGLAGEMGAPGEQGAQGAAGATGAQGQQGEQGAQGAQGQAGSTGAMGATGATGADGEQGEQGEQGVQGEPGVDGLGPLLRFSEASDLECFLGGTKVETGIDGNGNGVLDHGEENADATSLLCRAPSGWRALPALPAMQKIHSFSLASDGASLSLGVLFEDESYRQALIDNGNVVDEGGTSAFIVFPFQNNPTLWLADGPNGRTTTSESHDTQLIYGSDGSLYYTAREEATPNSTEEDTVTTFKQVEYGDSDVTLPSKDGVAYKSFSAVAGDFIYTLHNKLDATLILARRSLYESEAEWSEIDLPQYSVARGLFVADQTLVVAFNDNMASATRVLAVNDVEALFADEDDLTEVTSCSDSVDTDVQLTRSLDDTPLLYVGCLQYDINDDLALWIERGDISDVSNVAWESMNAPSLVPDVYEYEIKLAAAGDGASLAFRVGNRLKVFANLFDTAPVFDEHLAPNKPFALARLPGANGGTVLTVGPRPNDFVKRLETYYRPH